MQQLPDTCLPTCINTQKQYHQHLIRLIETIQQMFLYIKHEIYQKHKIIINKVITPKWCIDGSHGPFSFWLGA